MSNSQCKFHSPDHVLNYPIHMDFSHLLLSLMNCLLKTFISSLFKKIVTCLNYLFNFHKNICPSLPLKSKYLKCQQTLICIDILISTYIIMNHMTKTTICHVYCKKGTFMQSDYHLFCPLGYSVGFKIQLSLIHKTQVFGLR